MAIAAHAGPASAGPLRLKAAGSLKPAFTELIADFAANGGGVAVQMEFGPSGTLRKAILDGAPTDLFASANLEHPRDIAATRGGTVVTFARNVLCALVEPGVEATSEGLLDRMLDPTVRLGISTPKADPSGDYAFAVFDKAEAVRPGAAAALKAKALQLTGEPKAPKPPPGMSAYGAIMKNRQADVFLTYCTNATLAVEEAPGVQIVALPNELAVGADFGMLVLGGVEAQRLGDYILSARGQTVLRKFGFLPP
jgi:ABC-type molybdate transport system substrate-binding protein